MRWTGLNTASRACRAATHRRAQCFVRRGAAGWALIPLLLMGGCAEDPPDVLPRPIVVAHPVPNEPGAVGAMGTTSRLGAELTSSPGASGGSLYFPPDFYQVRDADRSALQAHARRLLAHPDWRLRIVAHTDPVGPPDYNAELARMRALSVKKVLLGMGVPAQQLETAAYGESGSGRHLSQSQMAASRRVDLSYDR
jgi:peptidoglycan-associated lipoprotein